jgi:hypothetical protein
MYTETTLKSALTTLASEYVKQMPHWYNAGSETEEFDNAWQVYSNAANTQLTLLVLGDISIRSDEDLLQNVGTTANFPMRSKKSLAASNQKGSVLNEKYWWPMINDAWVLGGVHSLTPFHMAYNSRPPDDDLWDLRGKRPRVLGRELLGLFTFGYRRIRHSHEAKLGIVFAPVNKTKATQATFAEYLDAVKTATPAGIKDIFVLTACINWADYTLPTA